MSLIYGYSESESSTSGSSDNSQIGKNKLDIQSLQVVKFKETVGSFVAPLDDGKVEITGWTMSVSSTVIAVLLKAKKELTGLVRASIYSGDSLANSSHLMASPMQLSDMKLGRAAILFTGRNPRHTKMFANTRGTQLDRFRRELSVLSLYT